MGGVGGGLVEAAQGGQVTGDVDEVVVAGPALLEAAVPHRQRPFMQGSGIAAGVRVMRPAVHGCIATSWPGVSRVRSAGG